MPGRQQTLLFLFPEDFFIGWQYLIAGRILLNHKHFAHYKISIRVNLLKNIGYDKIIYHPDIPKTVISRLCTRDKFEIPPNFLVAAKKIEKSH